MLTDVHLEAVVKEWKNKGENATLTAAQQRMTQDYLTQAGPDTKVAFIIIGFIPAANRNILRGLQYIHQYAAKQSKLKTKRQVNQPLLTYIYKLMTFMSQRLFKVALFLIACRVSQHLGD